MVNRRAEIGLGDWVRVVAELPTITASERVLVARCLGLQADKLENTYNDQSTGERGSVALVSRKLARTNPPINQPLRPA